MTNISIQQIKEIKILPICDLIISTGKSYSNSIVITTETEEIKLDLFADKKINLEIGKENV